MSRKKPSFYPQWENWRRFLPFSLGRSTKYEIPAGRRSVKETSKCSLLRQNATVVAAAAAGVGRC